MSLERPQLLDSLLNFIQNPAPGTEGIILDLRSNFGGSVPDLHLLAGSMIPGDTRVGDVRSRVSNNRNEYSAWQPLIAYAAPKTNTLPCVVLTDAFSISMAEITTMALATRSNVTVIGDTTYGAQGPRNDGLRDLYLGGTFNLPAGWEVVMADFQTRYIDGRSYESIGFPPDQQAIFSIGFYNRTGGQDNMINAAINRLLGANLATEGASQVLDPPVSTTSAASSKSAPDLSQHIKVGKAAQMARIDFIRKHYSQQR